MIRTRSQTKMQKDLENAEPALKQPKIVKTTNLKNLRFDKQEWSTASDDDITLNYQRCLCGDDIVSECFCGKEGWCRSCISFAGRYACIFCNNSREYLVCYKGCVEELICGSIKSTIFCSKCETPMCSHEVSNVFFTSGKVPVKCYYHEDNHKGKSARMSTCRKWICSNCSNSNDNQRQFCADHTL